MGKQRTPQGPRPGRRMPLRRGPAALAAAQASSETVSEALPDAPVQDVAPEAEITEAVAASESSAGLAEAAAEPAPAEPVETVAETVSEAAPASDSVAAEPAEAASEAAAALVSEEPAEVATADESGEAPVPAIVSSDPLLPVAALAGLGTTGSSGARAGRPAAGTAFRFAFAPARIDVEGIGVVLANYMHNESVAVFSYLRALGAARSPADMIRLNVSEMQRAADASLTCWSDIARRTSQGALWQRQKAAT